MAISDTSFYSSYQSILGTSYARGFQEIYNPASTLINYVNARQLLLENMSTSDVSNGLIIVNAHLNSENTYSSGSLNIVKTVLQTNNNFFYTNYGSYLRDYFNSTSPTKTISWQSSFKEAWYQANAQELVQQIGFLTWNGSAFVNYPAYSPITNMQNSATIENINNNYVTISGFDPPLSNFSMPGDVIVPSTGSLPNSSNISLGTTVIGLYNTNTLILSGNIDGSSTTLFTFRPIKNPEYLEFRFGTAMVTGLAATSILSNIGLGITLLNGIATNVTLSTTNATGRLSLTATNNTNYKSLGISSVLIKSGSVTGLGTQQSLEIWVKGTN